MTPPDPDVRLRPVAESDVPAVLALNQAEVEKLAPMDEARLHELRRAADRFDVVEVDHAFAGFVVTFAPGADYDGEHYDWFGRRYDDFYYLDRVALVEGVRRRGVGGAVYREVESSARPHGRMTLEVNLVPENAPSLAFHRNRGYVEVGRSGDEHHLVSLMVRSLGR
jgi:predicted GNAT superfamily acetyltransferase